MPIHTRKQIYSFSLMKKAAKALREVAKACEINKSVAVEDAILAFHEHVCGIPVKAKP